jgi:hypothetical protein
MPAMDAICFLGDDSARVNFVSVTTLERGAYSFEDFKGKARQYIRDKEKLRWAVREVLGDLYWTEAGSPEQVLAMTIKTMPKEVRDVKELEEFVNQEANKPIPLVRPQWEIWWQDDFQGRYSLMIYKQHHSMCDGISCMSFHIGQGECYDTSCLLPFPRKISFLERLLVRLSFPFYLPKIIWGVLKTKQDLNPLHDGKRQLSGRKLVSTSKDIKFADVKRASKNLGVTINDLVTSSLGSALKSYFEDKGDRKTS